MVILFEYLFFFFSSRRRHTRFKCDWSSDVCSSDLRIENGLGFKRLPGDRGADNGKNTRPDHCANAQRYKRPWPQRFFEPMFRLFGVGNQLVDGLLGEILAGQKGLLVLLKQDAESTC